MFITDLRHNGRVLFSEQAEIRFIFLFDFVDFKLSFFYCLFEHGYFLKVQQYLTVELAYFLLEVLAIILVD